jgi:hypothetical protein
VRHSQGSGFPASANPQEPLQTPAVEADDNVVVDRDDRDGHPPCSRDQLLASRRVIRDVLRRKVDAMGRKKLFRRVTRLSG